MLSNGDIRERSIALGITDIRFAPADDMITVKGECLPAASLVSAASCIIVLFMAYLPAKAASNGNIALSPYYIASNMAYGAAKALTAFIRESGAQALHTASISAKAAALGTGGFIGDNGFYYHDAFGSHVCIQTIISSAGQPEEYGHKRGECLHCGACKQHCAAVDNLDFCVRAHMHGVVPQALREGVYQLLGCERCQSVCPLNTKETSRPFEFSVKELLCGGYKYKLKELAGANMARTQRVLSQAALYAGAANMRELTEELRRLAETADDPVKTHALWAHKKLTGDS